MQQGSWVTFSTIHHHVQVLPVHSGSATSTNSLQPAQLSQLQNKAIKYRTHKGLKATGTPAQPKQKMQDHVVCKRLHAGTVTKCPPNMLELTELNLPITTEGPLERVFPQTCQKTKHHKAAQSPPVAHEPDSQELLARHAPEQREPYLFAGELRPPLPKEEVDRVVATESLLASSTGRVLGRRSGRPRWEPELKHRLFHHQNTLATGQDLSWIPSETSKTFEH